MDFIHSLTYHTVSQSTPSTTSRIMVHVLYPAFTPFLTRPFFPLSPVTSSVASTITWPGIHPTITSRRKTIPRCSSPQVGQHENDANTHPCHVFLPSASHFCSFLPRFLCCIITRRSLTASPLNHLIYTSLTISYMFLSPSGLNDPRVAYWEPAKWVAKLREMKTNDRPLLFKTDMSSGHFR